MQCAQEGRHRCCPYPISHLPVSGNEACCSLPGCRGPHVASFAQHWSWSTVEPDGKVASSPVTINQIYPNFPVLLQTSSPCRALCRTQQWTFDPWGLKSAFQPGGCSHVECHEGVQESGKAIPAAAITIHHTMACTDILN